jgi:hypothetical protein
LRWSMPVGMRFSFRSPRSSTDLPMIGPIDEMACWFRNPVTLRSRRFRPMCR